MKRLLIALLILVAFAAGATAIKWFALPMTARAQTNTFCASNLTCTVTAAWTYTAAITPTAINTIRYISPTNPQGWGGLANCTTDLGACINNAFIGNGTTTFSNCNSTGACEVDIADGAYTVATTIAPTGPNLFLKFGLGTITYNVKLLDISAANGFHLKGAGGGFLQSSGYPDTAAKATKFLCGTATATDGILANPGVNVILGGIILEDFAIVGCGAGAASGSNIHFNAIQAGGNIASVRDFSIHGVYSINAKGNGLQMTGAVFCPSNFCVSFSQFNFNQASNILLEAGGSTVVASQVRITNVDTEASQTGWGREYQGSFTDVYDNNGTVQGNSLGGSLCNGGQCRYNNYHVEGQNVVDVKFTGSVSGSSVTNSNLAGNAANPVGKGIWNQSSGVIYIANNVLNNGHAANSDIFNDAGGTNLIIDPQTAAFSITDSNPTLTQRRDLFPSTGRTTVALVNGANQNIVLPLGTVSLTGITGPTGAFSTGGFIPPAAPYTEGRTQCLYNSTTQAWTINNLDAGSTAANRIFTGTGANVVLNAQNTRACFQYETADSVWMLMSYNLGDQPIGAAMTQTLTNKSTSAGPLAGVVASGTSTMTAGAVTAATCQAAITSAATNTATTDSIEWSYATAPTLTTDALLTIAPYVTSGNVNFTRCNPTNASITGTGIVINWRVIR